MILEEKRRIVYRVYNNATRGGANVRQVVLPESLRKYVVSVVHDTITRGHLGIKKTRKKIMSSFYRPGMYDDVARYCCSFGEQGNSAEGSIGEHTSGGCPF